MTARTLRSFASALPFSFPALIAILVLGGCFSTKEYVPESDPKAPPRPTMQGYADFFDGKVLVEASIGRGFRMRPGKMKEFDRNNRRGGSEESPFAEIYYLDDKEDAEDQYFIPRMNNSTLPPVALRLRVTNQFAEPVEIEFTDCDSTLGNFAVRPEKISIPAGETAGPDPMTSLLGITNDEIQLKVGLKMGATKEVKTLVLHIIETAVAPTDGKKPERKK